MKTKSDARKAVLRQLAHAYDIHAEVEQKLVGEGHYQAAEAAHDLAVKVLRAYRAEQDDPPVTA